MRLSSLALLSVVAGCSLSQDAFIARYGEQTCDWLAACTDEATDASTCLAEQEEGLDALINRGCVFVPDAGADCLDQRDGATCDDPFGLPADADACERVVDCEG